MVGFTFLHRLRRRSSLLGQETTKSSASTLANSLLQVDDLNKTSSAPTLATNTLQSPSDAEPPYQDAFNDLLIGEQFLFGQNGCEVDTRRAIKYLKKAAFRHGGDVQAQAVLGFCYEFELGVKQDYKAAENLYICAAVKGNGVAMIRLAFLRRYGRPGVKMDRVEADEWIRKVQDMGEGAVAWFKRAAEEGNHPAAQYALGVCYHDG